MSLAIIRSSRDRFAFAASTTVRSSLAKALFSYCANRLQSLWAGPSIPRSHCQPAHTSRSRNEFASESSPRTTFRQKPFLRAVPDHGKPLSNRNARMRNAKTKGSRFGSECRCAMESCAYLSASLAGHTRFHLCKPGGSDNIGILCPVRTIEQLQG